MSHTKHLDCINEMRLIVPFRSSLEYHLLFRLLEDEGLFDYDAGHDFCDTRINTVGFTWSGESDSGHTILDMAETLRQRIRDYPYHMMRCPLSFEAKSTSAYLTQFVVGTIFFDKSEFMTHAGVEFEDRYPYIVYKDRVAKRTT